VIFSVVYLLARRLLGCLMILARREVSKDAELVHGHEKVVLAHFPGSGANLVIGLAGEDAGGSSAW